jgi:hypothetical protein
MEVTHIKTFGWLGFVHVTVHTFSHAMWATCHTGEASCKAELFRMLFYFGDTTYY